MMETMITLHITNGVANNNMTNSINNTEENGDVFGYTTTRVGDHTILTPKDKKASVFQKVTPREQYAVARDVANRAINEINTIRSNRPSSFTGGINDANIAARIQAAETYGDTLPGGRGYSRARETAYDIADSYRNVLATAPPPARRDPPVFEPTPDTPNYDSWINQQYNELLGRDAGSEGLNYWTGDLIRGQTKDQVRSNIIRGDEYQNRLQLINDYRTEFGNPPDEDWLDARVGPGGEWLMEGYGNKSATTSRSGSDVIGTRLDWVNADGSIGGGYDFDGYWRNPDGTLGDPPVDDRGITPIFSMAPTSNSQTPEAPPNMALTEDPNWDKSRGYAPGSFGIGPEYDKYTKLFQRQIDEGLTLEQSMYLSRTATPEDFLKAFGDRSMKRKWGGGSKGGNKGTVSMSLSSRNGKNGVSKAHSIGAGTYGGLSGTKSNWGGR